MSKKTTTRYVAIKGRPYTYRDTITGKVIWRERINGTIIQRSTGEVGITAAVAKIKRFRLEVDVMAKAKKDLKATWTGAFEQALLMKSQKKLKTYKAAKDAYRRVHEFFEHKDNSSMVKFERGHEETWAQFKEWSKIRDIEAKGRVTQLEHDRTFLIYAWNRALKKGWVTYPLKAKDMPLDDSNNVNHGTYLTDDQVNAILDESDGNLKVQILMAVTMGMRKGEILTLEADGVNLETREVTLLADGTKTKKSRVIPISDDVYPHLEALHKECEEKQGLFIFHGFLPYSDSPNWDEPASDLSAQWSSIRLKLGHLKMVKDELGRDQRIWTVIFKDFRRTCATNLVKALLPLPDISRVMGHSIKMLTEIYNEVNLDMKKEIREVFKGRFKE